MEKIYAAEANFILEFLAKTENATEADRKAAHDAYGNFVPDSILTFSDDRTEAHISIAGPLSRTGPTPLHRFFGYNGTSYFEILDSIKTAEEDPATHTTIFDIDTGGGEVFGVDLVQQAIIAAKNKTIAINSGMVASAGYYIGSACDEFFALEPVNMTGSVGVVITAVDFSKMYEEFGIKVVQIVSRNAPKKRADIKTKEGRSILQDEADALENVFMTRVAEGRGTTLEDVRENFGKGTLLVAQNPDGPDAIKVGMIDGLVGARKDDPDYIGSNTASADTIADSHEPAEPTPSGSAGNDGEDMEETMDNLTDFLASSPAAMTEYNTAIAAERTKGVEEGRKEVEARVNKVAPIMASESYDAVLKTQAEKALKGEMSLEAFESVVAMEDMRLERAKSETAGAETTAQTETPGQTHEVSTSEVAESEADVVALAAADKGGIK